MATLAPRPGPAIIQRANSLQASDTSHTSGSTADTSVSHANSKPSPVSSIGESISSVVHKPVAVHIPAARPARPLPVPPQPAPAPTSASTSTLKLSNQDSHSTLGKSSGPASKTTPGATQTLTKSKTTPPRKLLRTRSEALERTPAPPPSSYAPRRISDDEPWVSISVMPAVAERPPHVDADERLPVSAQDLDTRAQASYAKPTAASSNKRAKSKRSASTAPVNHTAKITPVSKSLPRLPADPPQPEPEPQPQHPPQGNDAAWKLEFRGMVRLVRWVSRGGKRAPLETENANENEADRERDNEKLVIEEKENVGARKGFSITSEARRSRDSYNQPRPIVNGTGAAVSVAQPRARPLSLARPRPKLEDGVNAREREQEREREREKEGNKRRLTKSNPGLVNFVLPDTRTSTDASRISNDSRPDAKRLRTSTDAALKDVPEMPLGPAKGMNSFPNRTSSLSPTHAASSSHPPLPSSFFRPPSFLVGSSSQPAASSLSTTTAPVGIDSVRPYSAESTALAYLQPEPMSVTATETALGVQLAAGPSQSHGFMPFSPSGTTSALSPVSEVPIFTSGLVASPPELTADINEFPWAATRPPRSKIVVGEVVPTGFGASTGGKMDAGTSSIVTGVLGNAPAAASGGLLSPLSNSMSPLSPLSSSASPLMSNVVSPMSSSSSPLMPSDANLSDSYVLSHIPGTTASSLSYATARSSRNSITAQAIWDSRVQAVPVPDRSSYERKRTSTEITYRTSTDHAFLRGTATDIGHGCSTRAASPTPSDRYAFSEDGHAPAGILRTLSTLDHSNTPLTAPRRPFMHARGSSGSVTNSLWVWAAWTCGGTSEQVVVEHRWTDYPDTFD
ncbi:hypothetical protein BDV93DRAFT_197627 [Ceratobasidium sp. AG-I]|nr:hypothetical protein BDV93DRAFT_197627 [Ceratobasidium sp. AG-I]